MIIHIEIALNTRSINVSDLKIVVIDNLSGKSERMKWPFSKIVNVLITRKLNFWKNNCQKDIEKLRVFINQRFNEYFTNIITHINISEIQSQNIQSSVGLEQGSISKSSLQAIGYEKKGIEEKILEENSASQIPDKIKLIKQEKNFII